MRICRLEDSKFTHADVVELFKESFKQWQENGLDSILLRFTPTEFAKNTEGAVVLVAEDTGSGELIGTTTMVIHHSNGDDWAYHKYLAVKPSHKGKGVASQLLKSCVEIAKNCNYSHILSNTSVDANWSVNWHMKNGFKKDGYYSIDTSDYYCYRFRYQIKSPSIWNNTLFTRTIFCYYFLKTRAMKRKDGSLTLFGKLLSKIL